MLVELSFYCLFIFYSIIFVSKNSFPLAKSKNLLSVFFHRQNDVKFNCLSGNCFMLVVNDLKNFQEEKVDGAVISKSRGLT